MFEFKHEIREASLYQLMPLYLIAALIVVIGSFPQEFLQLLVKPVGIFTSMQQPAYVPFEGNSLQALRPITLAAWFFFLLVASVYGIRWLSLRKQQNTVGSTWGCGYIAPNARQQYTGSSFARTYSKLFRFVLLSVRREKDIEGIFPSAVHYETHSYDKIESWLIDKPVRAYHSGLRFFLFLQNGRLQYYIIYGIIFISSVIFLPQLYEGLLALVQFLKQL